MSATRDKSQNFTFVYSNLYQLYLKGIDAAKSAVVPAPAPTALQGLASGKILKASDLNQGAFSAIRIEKHEPTLLMNKRIELRRIQEAAAQYNVTASRRVLKPASIPLPKNEALEGLKENLKSLNDLHARLRFMLKELEELTQE